MKWPIHALCLLLPALAQAQTWHSGTQQTQLVELYTSEGCSSCPPADQWFSSFKDNQALFKSFVPIAFHVDYWDYIGWQDRFADPQYSQRQRQYVRQGLISQVYTPGIIINSQEWRWWFRGVRKLPTNTAPAKALDVTLKGDIVEAHYDDTDNVVLNFAYLGMGLASDVTRGENSDRHLQHDFVVLNHFTLPGNGQWQIAKPEIPEVGQQQTALAVWVSAQDSQQVLQAVGGYIE